MALANADEGIELSAEECRLRALLEKSADDFSSQRNRIIVPSAQKREHTIQTMVALAFSLTEASELNLNFIISGFRDLEATVYRRTTLKALYYGTLAKTVHATKTTIESIIKSGDLDKIGTH